MPDSKRVPQIAANASAPEPKLKVDYVSPDLLRPSPRNARLHSRKKIRQLSQSIEALKVIAPILVDEDFEILAGHARWAAAKLLSLREIPVVQIKHLSEAEKRVYRLADNRFSEKATWDNELLSIEIKELGSKLINMIAFTNLQQFSEAIGNCDKSLCLHAKIQQV